MGWPDLLARELARYGPRPRAHAAWVALAGFGALAIAAELPSPDHALPGLWAAVFGAASVAGAARLDLRVAARLAAVVAVALAAVGVAWALVGGWPLVGVGAACLGVGRLAGGPRVLTVGPRWLVSGGSGPAAR